MEAPPTASRRQTGPTRPAARPIPRLCRPRCRRGFIALSLPPAAFAQPAAFNASPGHGTFIDGLTAGASEIAVESVVLAGETVEPDGRVLLSFNATLRNSGGGYHDQVKFALDAPGADWPIELVSAYAQTAELKARMERLEQVFKSTTWKGNAP